MPGSLEALAEIVRGGLTARPDEGLKISMSALFGERYYSKHLSPTMLRDAYLLGKDESGIPYAGFINPDNSPSGQYGGASVVWFPTADAGTLIAFVVGTGGLAPDEGILMRPGHRRRIAALRRYLSKLDIIAWTKPDPSALGVDMPKAVAERFPGFEKAFQRYGHEMYCVASVPQSDSEKSYKVVQAFLDLYALERNWQVLKAHEDEFQDLHIALREGLFITPTADDVRKLLQQRRFVILQGPPGTGKTRVADEVLKGHFRGHGMTVQFHPAITYEDFVVGLSPDENAGSLQFHVRKGWLLDAVKQAQSQPFLLIIDEVNRADLGKVLGEAIYLFEAAEVGGERSRKIQLPHPVEGVSELSIPENLYVLATMNTADRSIQNLDLAIRRRFAFMTVPPDRAVVDKCSPPKGLEFFDKLSEVFVEHAPSETFDLMPGHAYFIATSDEALKSRFRYELVPLIDEYLRQGFLGPATSELYAVRDMLEDWIQ
jgi:5-methylcytosine-specific restriction enzyme B